MTLDDGDSVPGNRLPRPLALCVPRGTGATFALYGWDNDDDVGDPLRTDFDDKGDDDELLTGFQVRFGSNLPDGERVAGTSSSADLEVHYRVDRVDPSKDTHLRCRDDEVKPGLAQALRRSSSRGPEASVRGLDVAP